MSLSILIGSATQCTNNGSPVGNKQEQSESHGSQEDVSSSSFSNLIGEWTVSADVAGVKMDVKFNKDGSFTQKMGSVDGSGTWSGIDAEHVKITTQYTKGQNWKITDITKNSMNVCWNPNSPNPKIIPMQRIR